MTDNPFETAFPPLVVGVRVRSGDVPPSPWCAALARRIAAHPTLELRALVREPVDDALPDARRGAGRAATGPVESVVRALLRGMDGPPRSAGDAAPDDALPEHASDPAALTGCDVVLEIGPCGSMPAPADGAPGTRTWCLDARRIEAETEATLLGGFDLGDLVLRERGDAGADGRVHAVHTLPAQSFSRSERVAAAFGALPDLVTSALVRLAAGVPEPVPDAGRLAARTRLLAPDVPDARPGATSRRLRAACRLSARRLATRVRNRFSEERWELAWHPETPPDAPPSPGAAPGEGPPSATPGIDALLARPVAAWRPLLYAAASLRADPHALDGPDGIDLWFEDLPDGRGHARIGHAGFAPHAGAESALAPRARDGAPGPAIESGHHLSYPFAFEHDGARLMVPETASAGRVELYRQRTADPRRWTAERVLLDGLDVTDTTLLRRDGRWWLFTNAMSHPAVDERDLLLLHHASSLDGPWTPHPLNPIVRGVAGARMAGALFEMDGVLVRPSQYGGRRYGHGLNLNRVDALDATRYAETPLGRIVPTGGDGWLGLHTISRAGGVTFVDRLRRRPRPGPTGIVARAAERLTGALVPAGRAGRTMR